MSGICAVDIISDSYSIISLLSMFSVGVMLQ